MKKHIPDTMDKREIKLFNQALLTYPYSDDFETARNILICRIILFGGILPSELVDLKHDNISKTNNKMILRIDGAGTKKRDIELPMCQISDYLDLYLSSKGVNENGYLFCAAADKSKKMNVNFVNVIVKKMLNYAKINKKELTPKLLRTTFAVYLHNNPNPKTNRVVPLKVIQALLGHSNIQHTKDLLGYEIAENMSYSDIFKEF